MSSQYRVVFKGKVLDGFDEAVVRSKAVVKLKTTEAQIDRLFSGHSSILKKGVSHEIGERYIKELSRIGMLVVLEEIPATPATDSMKIQLPDPAATKPSVSSDLEKTQLADPDALSRYLDASSDTASEPTIIVSPSHAKALSERFKASDPASAPTMIVSPASAPTMLVSPQPSAAQLHDPEKTLIANPDALDAYLKNHSDPIIPPTATDLNLAASDPHNSAQNPDASDTRLAPPPASQARQGAEIRSVPITITKPEVSHPQTPELQPSPFSGLNSAAAAQPEAGQHEIEAPTPSVSFFQEHKAMLAAGLLALVLCVVWWFI